jgi:hypothetical protein
MLLHVTNYNIESYTAKGLSYARHMPLSEVHGLFRKVAQATGFCCLVQNNYRAVLGIEPRTSRTLSDNHTTRPNSHLKAGSRRVFDYSVWAKSALVPFCSPFLPTSIFD